MNQYHITAPQRHTSAAVAFPASAESEQPDLVPYCHDDQTPQLNTHLTQRTRDLSAAPKMRTLIHLLQYADIFHG
jgi:hypothetical protein